LGKTKEPTNLIEVFPGASTILTGKAAESVLARTDFHATLKIWKAPNGTSGKLMHLDWEITPQNEEQFKIDRTGLTGYKLYEELAHDLQTLQDKNGLTITIHNK